LDPYLEDPNHNQRTILAAVVASLNEKRKTSSFGHRQMWLVFPSIAYVDGKMVNHGPGQVRLVPQEFHFSVTNLSRTVASLTKLRDETEKVLIAMYAGHRGGVS
jgi:hypothetical protein